MKPLVSVCLLLMWLLACGSAAPPRSPHQGYLGVMEAIDINGKLVGAERNAHATLVVVFASWCPPCRQELSLLGDLDKRQPGLRIIGLNAYEEFESRSDQTRLRSFLAVHAPWLQVVVASESLLAGVGGVPKIPTIFIYDRRGVLVESFMRNKRPPPTAAELDSAVALAMR